MFLMWPSPFHNENHKWQSQVKRKGEDVDNTKKKNEYDNSMMMTQTKTWVW